MPRRPALVRQVTHRFNGQCACGRGAGAVQMAAMDDLDSKIGDAVRHAPEWVRHDLLSNDRLARVRAEETLAAMIANALRLKRPRLAAIEAGR